MAVLLHSRHHDAWLLIQVRLILLTVVWWSMDWGPHWVRIDRVLLLKHWSSCIYIVWIITTEWWAHILSLLVRHLTAWHYWVFHRIERSVHRGSNWCLGNEALLMHKIRRLIMRSMAHWNDRAWTFVATHVSLLLLMRHSLCILGVTILNRVWVAWIDVILILHVPSIVSTRHLRMTTWHSMLALVTYLVILLTTMMRHSMAWTQILIEEILLLADPLRLS